MAVKRNGLGKDSTALYRIKMIKLLRLLLKLKNREKKRMKSHRKQEK